MNILLLIPVLVAVGPGFSALLFVLRARPGYWLDAVLGGAGWLLALTARATLLVLARRLSMLAGVLVAALAAGVFEETVRYLVVKHRIGEERLYKCASIGLGWGLAEALIVYVLQVPLASSIYGYSWVDLLPGAVERNTAMIFHLSMTLLAVAAATRNSRIILAAITMHTLLDMAAGLVALHISNPWIIEGVIGLLALSLIVPVVVYTKDVVRR
ncbi:MAG: YhfC family glutamic-type intramembrane protease [Pyrodictiaceae archaeon]